MEDFFTALFALLAVLWMVLCFIAGLCIVAVVITAGFDLLGIGFESMYPWF